MLSNCLQIRMTCNMGKGIFAIRNIHKSQILLNLQEENYITYDELQCHRFFCRLINFEPKVKDRKTQLAFYLAFVNQNKLKQKQNCQKIVNYVNDLPPYFNSLICWSEKQLNRINDGVLRSKIKQKKQDIQNSFDYIKFQLTNGQEKFNSFIQQQESTQGIEEQGEISQKQQERIYIKLCQNISIQDVLHFYAAIDSRRIYHSTTHDLKNQVGALAPLLQLFNHSQNCQAEKTQRQVKATQDIEKQKQVFICYGDFDAEQLLQIYGIVKGIQIQMQIETQEQQDKEAKSQRQRKLIAQKYNLLLQSQIQLK